jgi:hypothetical protein
MGGGWVRVGWVRGMGVGSGGWVGWVWRGKSSLMGLD